MLWKQHRAAQQVVAADSLSLAAKLQSWAAPVACYGHLVASLNPTTDGSQFLTAPSTAARRNRNPCTARRNKADHERVTRGHAGRTWPCATRMADRLGPLG